MGRASEDDLIARYFAPLAAPGALQLKDDAAVLAEEAGQDLVLTVDAIVEGVHFLSDDPPSSVAWKALAVNLSDLAAKGARPVGFLLTLALPDDWTEEWLAEFSQGLGEASRRFSLALLGGDTVRARGPLSLSVTALGRVPAGRAVRRTTARPGDILCVTSTIGDAALGLPLLAGPPPTWSQALSEAQRAELVDRYRRPRPRLEVADALLDHASAAMDVSDGFVGDIAKLLRASGVSATVEVERVPLSAAARAAVAAESRLLDACLTGGDDYEVLCTVPEGSLVEFLAACEKAGVPAAAVGRVVAGEGAPVFRENGEGRNFARGSYSHF